MFTAALLTAAQNCIHRGMKKFWYIHTMEYYAAMQKDGQQLHTTQKNLTDVTLSERSQTPKNAC